MCGVSCPTAVALFEDYSNATIELFEATDKLAVLVGQHEKFAETKKQAEELSTKCRAARQTLEQHWKEHGCRVEQSPTQ